MLRRRKLVFPALALAGIGVGAVLVLSVLQRTFFYPKARNLPPVVDQSIEALFLRLEGILETNNPGFAKTLNPGLSDAQIAALEIKGSFRLSNDLKALYRWHNGAAANTSGCLLPGHRFPSLEEIVRERAGYSEQEAAATALERGALAIFAGHRKTWICIFDDGTGDGYFYDSARAEANGAFFNHFGEVRYYLWFPSLRNFFAGVIEAYESGVFKIGNDGLLTEDAERSQKIWERFGRSNETQL